MSMHDAIRDLIVEKLERERAYIDAAPRQYMVHLKVWFDEDGSPIGVTIDPQEAQPARKWRRGREAA
jgi:hypothetical protein